MQKISLSIFCGALAIMAGCGRQSVEIVHGEQKEGRDSYVYLAHMLNIGDSEPIDANNDDLYEQSGVREVYYFIETMGTEKLAGCGVLSDEGRTFNLMYVGGARQSLPWDKVANWLYGHNIEWFRDRNVWLVRRKQLAILE